MTALIVAVDVGNSAIKLQSFLQQPQRPAVAQQAVAFRYDRHEWIEAVLHYRSQLAQPATPSRSDDRAVAVATDCRPIPVAWRVASVNLPASDQLRQLVLHHFPSDAWRMITWRDIPLRIDVHQPQVVGIDRLVGGWAAWRRVADDVAVVDAGSAVTVDLVERDGVFRGGAILPGLGLQYRALAAGTAALPQLNAAQTVEPEATPADRFVGPGRDTAEAIRLGVMTGIVAGITRLADIYRTASGRRDPLAMVLTGGDAVRLAPLLRPPLQVVPGLVVEALAELPDHPV